MLHTVIMAGGSGTRFWPASTRETPKQFLNLFGDRTMLQMTADRVRELTPPERILVVTNDRYTGLVSRQLPDLPVENIVGEPVARNTAPCIAYAAELLRRRDPDATMIVLPADHYIRDEASFRSVLSTAATQAREDCLVTIGIKPDRPETGYGYIEYDPEPEEGAENEGAEIQRVRRFREKPDTQTALQLLSAGNNLWNSGMFIWKATAILNRFEQHQPEIYRHLSELGEDAESDESLHAFFTACPSISVDYGIMEQASPIYVVPGDFGWNDVGSWNALYDQLDKDEENNTIQAKFCLTEQSTGNLVQVQSDRMIALVGVENLAVVETDKAILVCNMDEAQGVREIVAALRESKRNEFL